MLTIQNDVLIVKINPKGAELSSIYHKLNQLEYLWSGDPLFWAKQSPVLFPIVGSLKEDKYFYGGKSYQLSRHGFARDSVFESTEQSDTTINLTLKSNEQTMEKYPFAFQFTINYSLGQNMLKVSYMVKNEQEAPIYFSMGGHPAFKVPLAESTRYEDYYLEFNQSENAGRWPISKDGLIETTPIPLLIKTNHLPITKELFHQDALVFKQLSSNKVLLKSDKTIHGIDFDFTDFPYLGLWAAKNADFLCIEPWCGIADNVSTNQQLVEKEGINKLEMGEVFKRTWKVVLF